MLDVQPPDLYPPSFNRDFTAKFIFQGPPPSQKKKRLFKIRGRRRRPIAETEERRDSPVSEAALREAIEARRRTQDDDRVKANLLMGRRE